MRRWGCNDTELTRRTQLCVYIHRAVTGETRQEHPLFVKTLLLRWRLLWQQPLHMAPCGLQSCCTKQTDENLGGVQQKLTEQSAIQKQKHPWRPACLSFQLHGEIYAYVTQLQPNYWTQTLLWSFKKGTPKCVFTPVIQTDFLHCHDWLKGNQMILFHRNGADRNSYP